MSFCTFFLAPNEISFFTEILSRNMIRATICRNSFASMVMCLDASTADDDDPVITLGVPLVHAFFDFNRLRMVQKI